MRTMARAVSGTRSIRCSASSVQATVSRAMASSGGEKLAWLNHR